MQKYLLERSREVLLKRMQCQATRHLYEFMDEYVPVNDITELVQLLTPEDVCKNIELLLREGEISYEELHFDTLYRLTLYVADVRNRTAVPRKKSINPSDNKPQPDYLQTAQQALEVLKAMDITDRPKFQGAVHPSVDPDDDKYTVCFYCCRKKGRVLYRCPKCEIVYFCSELCNKLCNKKKMKHVCGLNFYKSRKVLQQQIAAGKLEPTPSKLSQKMDVVKSRRTARSEMKQEQEEKERRKRRYGQVQKRAASFICQTKLQEYVGIMKKHLKNLEEGGETAISLTQIAKDITDIALQRTVVEPPQLQQPVGTHFTRNINNIALDQNQSTFQSKGAKHEEAQKNAGLDYDNKPIGSVGFRSNPAILTRESKSSLQQLQHRKHNLNNREIPFQAHSTTKSFLSRSTPPDQVKVIYQRRDLTKFEHPQPKPEPRSQFSVGKRSPIMKPKPNAEGPSQAPQAVVPKRYEELKPKPEQRTEFTIRQKNPEMKYKTSRKPLEEPSEAPRTVLSRNRSSERIGTQSGTPSVKSNIPKTSYAKPEARSKKLYSTSIKRESPAQIVLKEDTEKAIMGNKRKSVENEKRIEGKPRSSSKDKQCTEICDSEELQFEEVSEDPRRKEKAVDKKGRYANYWFHQSFISKLAKLFPTIDFPKLLLPFACFAEGQLYYRFGNKGPIFCTNYSKL